MSKLIEKQNKRFKHELKKLNEEKFPYFTVYQDKNDRLLWYFILIGQENTVYNKGQYIGKIILSEKYPYTPPDFIFLTPNGRFLCDEKICLTNTGWHSSNWSPTIDIQTMLIQLYSIFIEDDTEGIGHIRRNNEIREEFALESIKYNIEHLNDIYKNFDLTSCNLGNKEKEMNTKQNNNE